MGAVEAVTRPDDADVVDVADVADVTAGEATAPRERVVRVASGSDCNAASTSCEDRHHATGAEVLVNHTCAHGP